MKLFHSTTFANLANIIRMGVMTVDNPHKEGHGDMLWFTASDDYGSDVRVSIEVPQEKFVNGTFEFVNKIHVVTTSNVPITEYKMRVVEFSPIYLPNVGAYVGFNVVRLYRLVNGTPSGGLEEIAFNDFHNMFDGNEAMDTILDYIRNKQGNINENRVMKISERQLRNIIAESIKKALNERQKRILNESVAYAYATFVPEEFSEDEWNELPILGEICDREYSIRFVGHPYYYPDTYDSQGDSGIDDIKVYDDDGLSQAIDKLNSVSPEHAVRLKNSFDDWCSDMINGDYLEFESGESDDFEPGWV